MKKTTNSPNTKNIGISATSVSEVTGIPRANCIRKLEKYIKMKVVEKNLLTKRYNLIPGQIKSSSSIDNPILDGIKDTIDIFSEFSSMIIRSLSRSR